MTELTCWKKTFFMCVYMVSVCVCLCMRSLVCGALYAVSVNSLFACVCLWCDGGVVWVWVCLFACVGAHTPSVCMYQWRPEVDLWCLFQPLSSLLKLSLLLTLEFATLVSLVSRLAPGIPDFCLPGLELNYTLGGLCRDSGSGPPIPHSPSPALMKYLKARTVDWGLSSHQTDV